MSFAYRTSEKPDDLTVYEFISEIAMGLVGFVGILAIGLAFLYLTDIISVKVSQPEEQKQD